jgi:hypothetical protein
MTAPFEARISGNRPSIGDTRPAPEVPARDLRQQLKRHAAQVAELRAEVQRVTAERDRLAAELDQFVNCVDLAQLVVERIMAEIAHGEIGMLNAERSFRPLKGCKDMPTLVAALRRHVGTVTPQRDDEEVA